MSLEEIREQVEAWRASGEPYAVAVLTGAWHSAPRRPGARFARSASGEIAGNVSAGCVEADLAERLDGVLAGDPAAFVTYGVSDETAHGVGLACGGTIEVHLASRSADDPVWPALMRCVDSRETVFLVTDVSASGSGRRWLTTPGGDVLAADASGALPAAALAAGRGLLETGGVVVLDGEGTPVTGSAAEPATLVEVLLPSRRLVVVGATPVGAALARLALAAGVAVNVVEPRAAYAAALDDAPVDVDTRWPDEALAEGDADASTAVAVVSHDDRLDVAALQAALRRPYGYVGLLGGGRTRRRRFEALREAGISEDRIAAVRAPIGLDIGAERPAEIALAILAEIVAAWRGADG